MSRALPTITPSSARNGATQKKGGSPGDARQKEMNMSNVAEMPLSRKQTAGEWLTDQIALSQHKVRTLVVELDVALARALLARNPDNRKLSATTVEKYARDIVSGSWAFNGEPVIIAKDGSLNDGQHRCKAVLAAKLPVQIVLVIGTERDSRLTIDQGKTRMAGDYLAMEGHTDSIALAAAAGYIWQYEHHGQISSQALYRPTKAEVMAVAEGQRDLPTSLAAISRKGSGAVGGRSLLAFCHCLFARRAGKPAADQFMNMLIEGAGLEPNSPILYARNRIMANRGRLKPNEKAELVFRTWGAWRRRETPRTLPINGGALPIVER